MRNRNMSKFSFIFHIMSSVFCAVGVRNVIEINLILGNYGYENPHHSMGISGSLCFGGDEDKMAEGKE